MMMPKITGLTEGYIQGKEIALKKKADARAAAAEGRAVAQEDRAVDQFDYEKSRRPTEEKKAEADASLAETQASEQESSRQVAEAWMRIMNASGAPDTDQPWVGEPLPLFEETIGGPIKTVRFNSNNTVELKWEKGVTGDDPATDQAEAGYVLRGAKTILADGDRAIYQAVPFLAPGTDGKSRAYEAWVRKGEGGSQEGSVVAIRDIANNYSVVAKGSNEWTTLSGAYSSQAASERAATLEATQAKTEYTRALTRHLKNKPSGQQQVRIADARAKTEAFDSDLGLRLAAPTNKLRYQLLQYEQAYDAASIKTPPDTAEMLRLEGLMHSITQQAAQMNEFRTNLVKLFNRYVQVDNMSETDAYSLCGNRAVELFGYDLLGTGSVVGGSTPPVGAQGAPRAAATRPRASLPAYVSPLAETGITLPPGHEAMSDQDLIDVFMDDGSAY